MRTNTGTVEAIYLAAAHGERPHAVASASGVAGKGLEGDRNFGDDDPESCNITLIEAEAFERQRAEHGLDLDPGDARRQVLVRGVDLSNFVGRRFLVGELECEGEERCEPCSHLVSLVGTRVVLQGLLHTGLRARILRGGTLRVGDEVRLSGPGEPGQSPTKLAVNGDA
ncbi:MAG TPA: MOSC domain-containing protein [Candidatus Dormibacteraeota bacterium]|nr:MOSC domain-containing protein [Candidatus Dormibacteraeota bacterium]